MQVWFSSVIRSKRRLLPAGLLALLALGGLTPAGAQTFTDGASPFGESRFLPVEQAFAYQLSIDSDRQLTVSWQIAPGYYMYQDKFRFTARIVPENTGSTADAAEAVTLPHTLNEAVAHNDEFFGDVMIYHHLAVATVSLPAGLPKTFTLQLEYQGCSEDGLCYPLQRDELPILL